MIAEKIFYRNEKFNNGEKSCKKYYKNFCNLLKNNKKYKIFPEVYSLKNNQTVGQVSLSIELTESFWTYIDFVLEEPIRDIYFQKCGVAQEIIVEKSISKDDQEFEYISKIII